MFEEEKIISEEELLKRRDQIQSRANEAYRVFANTVTRKQKNSGEKLEDRLERALRQYAIVLVCVYYDSKRLLADINSSAEAGYEPIDAKFASSVVDLEEKAYESIRKIQKCHNDLRNEMRKKRRNLRDFEEILMRCCDDLISQH